MQTIEAILFEPVGCLAEFPSGSHHYWRGLTTASPAAEFQAVDGASVYEDVVPALAELQTMGVKLVIASSLSHGAIVRFLEKHSLARFFSSIWSRDAAGGIKDAPLRKAIESESLKPAHTMFLTDTAEGLKIAKRVGVHSILMMNDPDEAKRLAMQGPSGGIVSLHELPDFVRLVAAAH
jgi:phosphoglycolate phosphatase-like HAD superfamily hydrolase